MNGSDHLKNKDLKTSLIFSLIGCLAGVLLGIFQVSTLEEAMKQTNVSQLSSSTALIVITVIQSTLYAFISAFVGLKLARKVELHLNFTFNRNAAILSVIIAIFTALLLSGSDKFIFARYLSDQVQEYSFSITYFFSSILYGGIVEELMLRLFLMSLLVLLIKKLFVKSNQNVAIPSWVYITALFLAALLFAAGHLPATAQLLGLSTPIVIRAFVLNGVAGLGFGYLYWKKGLSYAILAHMLVHIFNQLIFMPLFY